MIMQRKILFTALILAIQFLGFGSKAFSDTLPCTMSNIPDTVAFNIKNPCKDVANGYIAINYSRIVDSFVQAGCDSNLRYLLYKDLPFNHKWDPSCLDPTFTPRASSIYNPSDDTIFNNLAYGDYLLEIKCDTSSFELCYGENLMPEGDFEDTTYWFSHPCHFDLHPADTFLNNDTDGVKYFDLIYATNQHYAGYENAVTAGYTYKIDSTVDYTNGSGWMLMAGPSDMKCPVFFRDTLVVEPGKYYLLKYYYRGLGDSVFNSSGFFQEYQPYSPTIGVQIDGVYTATYITEMSRPPYIDTNQDAWKEADVYCFAYSDRIIVSLLDTDRIKTSFNPAVEIPPSQHKYIVLDDISFTSVSYCADSIDCSFKRLISLTPVKFDVFPQDVYFVCPRDTLALRIDSSLFQYNIHWNYCCTDELNPEKVIDLTDYTKLFTGGTFGGYVNISVQTDEGCAASDTTFIADFNPPPLQVTQLDSVINTTASKFDDFWKPVYSSVQWQTAQELLDFKDRIGFENGQSGINRVSTIYDYVDQRQQTRTEGDVDVSLRIDGIFNDFGMFNWHHPGFFDCVPEWKLNHTITQYNPASFEIENKDILKRKSAALYSYGNKLQIAVASNAGYEEIGFENFEEYKDNSFHQLNNQTGNIDIVPQDLEISYPYVEEYTIDAAYGRYALVKDIVGNMCCDIPLKVTFSGTTVEPFGTKAQEIKDYDGKILVYQDPCASGRELVVFQVADKSKPFPFSNGPKCDRFWTGKLLVERTIQEKAQTNNKVHLAIDTAHTGKNSIRIDTGFTSIPQYDLHLDPYKRYVIGAWIHTEDYNEYPPEKLENYNISNGIGITVNTGTNGVTFYPTGEVIEGWQRLEGVFQGSNQQISLQFSPNLKSFYLDDIRIFPENGSFQSYVYDPSNYRLKAILDQNNYATYYQYDDEGNLFSIKKETVEGIKTIQATQNYIKKKDQ